MSLFYKDREEFYLKYLADNRPPRMKQTDAMSVGSAFDAYVKSHLVERLSLGLDGFGKDELFEIQVEEHNRDFARVAGQVVFDAYTKCGALAFLMKELELSKDAPQFETTKERTIDGVPLLGKPDVYFITRDDLHVILDWKVNGYCANAKTYPKAGYVKYLNPGDKKHGLGHKSAQPMNVRGMTVNLAGYLEDTDPVWAEQTALYAWLEGEPVGGKFVCGIDQLVCNPGDIACAIHRGRVSEKFQHIYFHRIKGVWAAIWAGTVVTSERAEILDDYHKAFEGDTAKDQWFRDFMR